MHIHVYSYAYKNAINHIEFRSDIIVYHVSSWLCIYVYTH